VRGDRAAHVIVEIKSGDHMSPDPRPTPYIKRAPGRRMEGAAINDISIHTTTLNVYVRSHYSRTVYALPAHCLITTRDLTV
jgi:hypothetical protein